MSSPDQMKAMAEAEAQRTRPATIEDALLNRAELLLEALTKPDATFAQVPNVVRQSAADVIRELLRRKRA